ncbi:unnamed protein product [Caenorhabditis bovis]|uniref:Uncharacterized protein n=1 Tax=Caenorhabditis bovis TaxID=2654633 RepID=A0A8S1EB11_9PELO|nr:unnamed protein product [Caenorhabditis bovis]
MFMISKPNIYCGGNASFASSSCQSEYDGKTECMLESKNSAIGGLRGILRRNSSTHTQLADSVVCLADASQIEINCESHARVPFYVRVEVPTGEVGILHFNAEHVTNVFTPTEHGCGHGIWKFKVCSKSHGKEQIHSEKTMNLDGVGILFFDIYEDLEIVLKQKEFLLISHCHKIKH